MNQASSVLPHSPDQIFEPDQSAPNDVVKLIVNPIVFNVHERPSQRAPELSIVVKGWLNIKEPDFRSLPLKTTEYGTRVAYFRMKANTLVHVYGAHYDMDETRFGHPVFHVQCFSGCDFVEHIHNLYRRNDEPVNHMNNILRTVRTPTAQMDVFSVVTQICADHLVAQQSAPEVKEAFEQTRKACNFLLGVAHRLEFLKTDSATSCYRSTHWYNGRMQSNRNQQTTPQPGMID